ncbi:uncharacterized protein LOC106091609 isoform X1 [Stomoxys calcitrans]|uniref:BESS domain-containing protein n=1 Tax=Stomoxys calcitrans TaxID=35570 RepID=A0A1I8PLL5_STOCA|nr:uncharacterized protein LOC106091609 isoform X1 [Stomoxys calcitrans]XP_059216058.1 uncharacterized protein LOC106091609 isoform X1 [Stomoxys calcitrans]
MNDAYENYIKQENDFGSEEFITVLGPNQPLTTNQIKYENNTIPNEISMVINVKNEPLTDDALNITSIEAQVHHIPTLANNFGRENGGFVIYELDSQSNIPNNSVPRFTKETTLEKTAATKPLPSTSSTSQIISKCSRVAAPPILLNGKLRKRPIVLGNAITKTNIANKKACYNLEHVDEKSDQQMHLTRGTNENTNVANKKIINYLMQKKSKNKPTVNQEKEEKTEKFIESTRIPVSPPVNSSKLRLERNVDLQVSTINLGHSNVKAKEKPVFTTPSPKMDNLDALQHTATQSNQIGELKVKCLCRLTDNENCAESSCSSSSNEIELKDFFKQMYLKTRLLPKHQQRIVKTRLLQAICESEELVEKGKCCSF